MKQAAIKNKVSGDKKVFLHTEIPSEWDVFELGELFEFKNGINAGKESYGSGVKFINVMEVIYHDFIFPEMIPGSVQISDEQKELYLVKDGDVLFNRTSETIEEIGLSAVYNGEEEVVFGGFVIRGRPIVNAIDPVYKRYCLRSSLVRNQIIKSGQGAVRTNIGQGDLSLVKITLPPIAEQKSIGQILCTVDLTIKKVEQLVNQKELRKKWLMQQLLTGKKRLKGFDGVWKNMQLDNFIIESRIPSINNDVNRRITVKLKLKGIEKRDVRGSEAEDATYYFIRKKGQFIYGKQNLHKGAFGIIPDELDGFESSQDIPAFDFQDGVNPIYFFLFMSQESFYQSLEKISSGTGSKRIHPENLYKVKVKFPSSVEQTAIAQVLQAADKEINLLKAKTEKLREQKKGLMQQLLTGKKRLR